MNWWAQMAREAGLCAAIGAVLGMLLGVLHALGCWLLECIE